MLNKILNPFSIKVTEAKAAYLYVGMFTSIALHAGFYVTLIHFVRKFW